MSFITNQEEIPADILRYTFILLANEYGRVKIPFRKCKTPPQLTVSHVCSPWRRVALDSPELWDNVRIKRFNENKIDVLQGWLSRAMQRPVSIQLDLQAWTLDESTSFFNMVNLPSRLGKLTLGIHCQHLSTISELLAGSLDHLEKLDLALVVNWEATLPDAPALVSRAQSICFGSTRYSINRYLKNPRDQGSLHKSVGGRPMDLERFNLPWHGLRCLGFHGIAISLPQCMSLLSQTPLLEECYFLVSPPDGDNVNVRHDNDDDGGSGDDGESQQSHAGQCISLPRLQVLGLGMEHYKFDVFIGQLELPNLLKLKLIDVAWTSRTQELLKQRFNLSRLHEIDIGGYHHIHVYVYDILVDAPLLREIKTDKNVVMERQVLRGLSTGRLGRYLEVIDISCAWDPTTMLDMVETRQKVARGIIQMQVDEGPLPTGFKYFRFRSDEVVQLSTLERAKNLENDLGVDIRIAPYTYAVDRDGMTLHRVRWIGR
ncbi:hypothetical protein AX17_004205 [Amanita inopinata Kibby_2008]|nr:hypothetical protein AX17_004205 [Amanita inopinata Kibby_2008]